jgi:hypothetical protein
LNSTLKKILGAVQIVEANIKDDEWVNNKTIKLKEELDRLKTYEEELTLHIKI